MTIAAAKPAKTPTTGLPVATDTTATTQAEVSMKPSRAMFMMPERSLVRPPMAASRSGPVNVERMKISSIYVRFLR